MIIQMDQFERISKTKGEGTPIFKKKENYSCKKHILKKLI